MRLSILSENIRPRDFFDLYSLIYARQDINQDPGRKAEIDRRLTEVVNFIFTDHMNQLKRIIVNRLIPDEVGDKQVMGIYKRNGATFVSDEYDQPKVSNLDQIDVNNLLSDLIRYGQEVGGAISYFTSSNGRWMNLAKAYIELTHTPPSLNSRIMAIDKMYSMLHHNGAVTDYFDERRWIEDALNIRANAGPAGLLQRASDDVKQLAGHASYGMAERAVPNLQKLLTTFERMARSSGAKMNLHISGHMLHINGELYSHKMKGHTMTSNNFNQMRDPWEVTGTVPYTAEIKETRPYYGKKNDVSEFAVSVNHGPWIPLQRYKRKNSYSDYWNSLLKALA